MPEWIVVVLAIGGGAWAVRKLIHGMGKSRHDGPLPDDSDLALVGAPIRPRTPLRASAIALAEPDDE